jgi:PAS domain S-box-containing protein
LSNQLTLPHVGKWSIVSLLAGLFMTVLTVNEVTKRNEQQIVDALDSIALTAIEQMRGRITLYQYGLTAARGAILMVGSENLKRDLFRTFINSREVDTEFPGARGFGFIQRVAQADLPDFVGFAQADGWPDYTLKELSPNPGERFMILYIEPVERNVQAVGLDIGSEKHRRAAAQAAIDTGLARLTSPITLVQASGQSQQSFLFLLPVFAQGVTPVTRAERNALAIGWTYNALLMDEVLADLNLMTEHVHLELFDVTDPDERVQFYDNDRSATQNLHRRTSTHPMFGRSWEAQFSVQPGFIDALTLTNVGQIAILGLIISLLATGLVMSTLASRRNKQLLIDQQSRLAAIVESSEDAIISNNDQGVITSWNNGAKRIFGFTASEAIGQNVVALIVPAPLQADETAQGKKVQANEAVPVYETHYQAKSAPYPMPVAVTLSALIDSQGLAQGVSRTIRDISGQKAAEAAIVELNIRLESQILERTEALAELNTLFVNVLRASSEVAIIATDLNGLVTVFNSGAERLLAYNPGDVIGQLSPLVFHSQAEIDRHADEIWHHFNERVSGFNTLVFKAKRFGSETHHWTYIACDGAQVPVSVAVTGIFNESEELVGYLCIATDISRQLEHERDILAARDQLEMAASMANLGIWTWTLADDGLQWNDFMYSLYYDQPKGDKNASLDFDHWQKCIHPDDLEPTSTSLAAAINGTGSYDLVFRIILPDGRIRFVQAGARVERNSSGEAIRVTGFNLDVTSQRELEAVLRSAKEQSDAASAAKSTFLANMSHEIRTPMNAVLGMLHLVQQSDLTVHQQDYIAKAQKASKSLLGLLNDILDYSKIEAGKLELDPHSFAIEELMQDLAIVLSGTQGNSDVELLFDLDPKLPKHVFADKLRLKQVLINLATNALKFTRQGEVVVQIKEQSRTAQESTIAISIRDTGIGISPDQIERIFEGFVQAENSTTRRYGGTGLGLVITKNLVTMMGGELLVDSMPDRGSCFYFTLTVPVVTLVSADDRWQFPSQTLNLLIVDDNRISREIMTAAVTSLGWSSTAVESAQDVLTILQRGTSVGPNFDVMLLDWRMPNVGGEALIKTMLALPDSVTIPKIVVVTAHGQDLSETDIEFMQPPMIGYLTKPVTPQQIKVAIYQGLPELGQRASAEPTPFVDAQKRLENLKLLVVEDNELNRQVAQELLTLEGARVDLAEGGVSGVATVLAGQVAYDLVLMDLQMPDIDGLEATRRIRNHGAFGDLPILAMTANVSTEDRLACAEAGMNGHLGKPIDIDKVVASIIQALAGANRTNILDADPVTPLALAAQSPEVEAPIIENIADIMKRFGNNMSLFTSLLPTFNDVSHKLIADLERAVAHQDRSAAAAALHTLKGSGANMGASAFVKQIRDAEALLKSGPHEPLTKLLPSNLAQQLRLKLTQSGELLQQATAEKVPLATPIQTDKALPLTDFKAVLVELKAQLAIGSLTALTLFDQLPLESLPRGLDQHKMLGLKPLLIELNYPAAIRTLDELLVGL